MGLRQYCGSRQRPEHHQRTGHSDGPAAFDRAYVRALREFAGRPMTSDDFAKICEQESQQDLGWFFDQWVRSDRFLSYQIASQHCQEEAGIDQCQVKVKCLGTLKMQSPSRRVRGRYASNAIHDRWADVSVLKFRSNSPMKSARLDLTMTWQWSSRPGHDQGQTVGGNWPVGRNRV